MAVHGPPASQTLKTPPAPPSAGEACAGPAWAQPSRPLPVPGSRTPLGPLAASSSRRQPAPSSPISFKVPSSGTAAHVPPSPESLAHKGVTIDLCVFSPAGLLWLGRDFSVGTRPASPVGPQDCGLRVAAQSARGPMDWTARVSSWQGQLPLSSGTTPDPSGHSQMFGGFRPGAAGPRLSSSPDAAASGRHPHLRRTPAPSRPLGHQAPTIS